MALKNVRKLVIRLVLSVGFAFLISRLFFQDMATVKVLGFALALCGLAYVFEFLRKQN
jgi:mannose/fructose/N-acetylgalactosamine-specific phosphotransferase system component IIC